MTNCEKIGLLDKNDLGIEKFVQWEKERLEYSTEKIWQLLLPEKIRRILLLIKLNLGTNPHVFVEGRALKSGGLPVVIEYLRSKGWGNIQASTSTEFDMKIQSNPVLTLPFDIGSEHCLERLNRCGEEFSEIFARQMKPVFQERFYSSTLAATDWFWKNSMFIFYPNRWGEGKTILVGGGFSIETKLSTPHRDRFEVMKIEAAPGYMGADVGIYGRSLTGYRYFGIGEADFYPAFGLVTKNVSIRAIEEPKLLDPRLERLRDTAIEKLWKGLTVDPNFRSSLRELQNVVGTDEIYVDWYYHEDQNWTDSHKIICIDFERVMR